MSSARARAALFGPVPVAVPVLAVLVIVIVFVVLVAGPAGQALAAPRPPCLLPPSANAVVIDPFRAPSCPYCSGNRGIELATPAGGSVVAASAGRVSFAGVVAGTRYVVVEHDGGYRTTYGRLASVTARAGLTVAAGAVVGTSTTRLFFGLRLGADYVDPSPYLATFRALPQLVPLDGRNRRPPRVGPASCPGDGGTRVQPR